MTTSLGVEELKFILGDVVDALPARERDVILALHWERLHVSEIARRMGKKPSQVTRLRDRAYRRIRQLVEDGIEHPA